VSGAAGDPRRGRADGAPALDRLGLCPRCRHVQRVESARGSVFLLCTLAKRDARFAKYPAQPVRACVGFEAR
jgi:hypothetical protein